MKLKPIADNIIVERLQAEATKGGIVIPDSAKEKPKEGKVVAVGKGKRDKDGKLVPVNVKKGDKIIFASYAGSDVEIDGKEYVIMREEDILGIIED
ncbi:co-chaperone GroES [bacterium]|nr:co-chaperone GroES [bacterium]